MWLVLAALSLFLVGSASAFRFGRAFGLGRTLTTTMMADFYSIVEKDSKGNDFSFDKLRGKVVYGVNVASKCGYTASGYALLERISAMKEKGVEVLILPCNQFGGQEPGSASEIEAFCAIKNVKGANILTKADVNGPATRPTYKHLKEKGVLGDIAWNFAGAFIVDKSGNAVAVKDSKSVEAQISKLL
jgi:glutathione peroxidase